MNTFGRSNVKIMGSNSSRATDVSFSVLVFSCVDNDLPTGLILRPRSPTEFQN
jgi:hypothetical protein